MPNDIVKKAAQNFWGTKEGTTGMIVGIGAFLGIGWGAYKIMPMIASLLENTLFAFGSGAILLFLFYALVLDGKLRNRLWLSYQLLMKALTYTIIKYDPAGVLKVTQNRARNRLKQADQYRTKARGQVELLKTTLDDYKKEADGYLEEAQYLQSHAGSAAEISSRAMRLEELNKAYKELQPLYVTTMAWYDQMTHASETLRIMIDNMDFKIKLETTKYNVVRSTHSAWRMFRAAFAGSEEIEGLQNDAFAYMAQDYGQNIGEIEAFMQDSKPFIDSSDLRQAVNTERGMKLLEELSRRNLSIVAAEQPEQLSSASSAAKSSGYYINK
ncbi:hypothetical protein A9R05_43335 (plasmid) [Burkholderia sp. KK1]|uniref:Uncharacterized protein n=1 Tax=Burkholderia sp. M701 TaxID=326454 RepID=V5YP75_9BURK|nr:MULTISPECIES: hypothetical protein [Burkholderia]AQH05841.1 hypothetical protein A9R05_43335 [Burkholderia sp. KK1]BAO19064.1 hypothetical protein [Burkholderia sp. M701]